MNLIKNKKAILSNTISILLWIVFLLIASFAVIYLLNKLVI